MAGAYPANPLLTRCGPGRSRPSGQPAPRGCVDIAIKRTLIPIALAVALVVPATAAAKPSKTDKRHAQQECRAERGTTDAHREAFADKYGTNANDRNAFGKCVPGL